MIDLDYKGILSEIRVHCIKCNPQALIEQGLRGKGKNDGVFCKVIGKDCPFVVTSKKGPNAQCVAPSSKVFRKYGLRTINDKSTYLYGKSHFFFYLYHPDMNWQPPEMPDINRYGKVVDKEKDIWTLSHVNGNHYDDSKMNHQWLLKSEHAIVEPNMARSEPTSLSEAGIVYAL